MVPLYISLKFPPTHPHPSPTQKGWGEPTSHFPGFFPYFTFSRIKKNRGFCRFYFADFSGHECRSMSRLATMGIGRWRGRLNLLTHSYALTQPVWCATICRTLSDFIGAPETKCQIILGDFTAVCMARFCCLPTAYTYYTTLLHTYRTLFLVT